MNKEDYRYLFLIIFASKGISNLCEDRDFIKDIHTFLQTYIAINQCYRNTLNCTSLLTSFLFTNFIA